MSYVEMGDHEVELARQLREYTGNLRLLFVEDDKPLRERTGKLLAMLFARVDLAVNGLEGLETYEEGKYDLIITDIDMPEMCGIDMIRTIREFDGNQPVMVMTAYNEARYYMDLIKLGVDGFLLKPLEMLIFLYTLARVCKPIWNARRLAALEKEVLDRENRMIVMADALEHRRELSPAQIRLLKNDKPPMDARIFVDGYPTDLVNHHDQMASIDEEMELQLNRYVQRPGTEGREALALSFAGYAAVLDRIPEFANLSRALEEFARMFQDLDPECDMTVARDLIFGVIDNLRKWRVSVLGECTAADIHYLDASIINDCIQTEAILMGKEVEGEEAEFF